MKIAIFGIDGMLGSAVSHIFNQRKYNVIGIGRKTIDAQTANTEDLKTIVKNCNYVINCIGIIKPYINDRNSVEVERAIKVNALFPYILSQCGVRVIQIATDCVFDGKMGNYMESDKHNALDIYGKSKSLGEVFAENFMNLRCSIIGPEKKNKLSLLEWFRNQPPKAIVDGYLNHYWNGITTYSFANICKGIIDDDLWFYGLQHIVPANTLNKCDMLKIFANTFFRSDITITEINANESINRILQTNNAQRNIQLWQSAGYNQIPSIENLISEIKVYE